MVRKLLIVFLFLLAWSRAPLAQCPPPDSGVKEIKLHAAILENDANTVAQMISLGANPNARDPYGNTLLMCAADDNKNFLIVKLLILYKADVNATSNSGSTALMDACGEDNNLEIIEHLLKSGANINVQDRGGNTVLMDACVFEKLDLIKLLLSFHPDVNLPNYDGMMAIDFLDDDDSTAPTIKALLINAGAKPYGRSTPAFEKACREPQPTSITKLSYRINSLLEKIWIFYDSSRQSYKNTSSDEDYSDSLFQANQFLRYYLKINLPKLPWSLTDKLPKGSQIWSSCSKDKQIRVWGWDSFTGGSMPHTFQIVQYAIPKGIYIYDPNDFSVRNYGHNYRCDSIYSVTQNSGKTVYILVQNWRADGRSCGQTLMPMTIEDTALVPILKFFESEDGFDDELNYYLPDPTMYDYSKIRYISYNPDKKILYEPENGANDSPTKKYRKYYHDGTKFVRKLK